jgi:hypothetical protein
MTLDPWQKPDIQQWSQLLLTSYEAFFQRPLLERSGTIGDQAKALFEAPFMVVSHGVESDPILNYGNQTTLKLWVMSWEELTQTPSRHTAEPLNQSTRAKILAQVAQQGYIERYEGVRISSTGQRFLIQEVTIWNLLDDLGIYRGQAATCQRWTFL